MQSCSCSGWFRVPSFFLWTIVWNYFSLSVLGCSQKLMSTECSSMLTKDIEFSYVHRRHGMRHQLRGISPISQIPSSEEKQKTKLNWGNGENHFCSAGTIRQLNKSEWKLSKDGYLKVINVNSFYPPRSFCLKTDIGLAFICELPEDRVFFWKRCCKEDELLHRHSNTCIKKLNATFRPEVDYTVQIISEEIPRCSRGAKLQRYSSDNCESSSNSAKTFNRYLLEQSVQTEYACRFRVKDGDIAYESSEGLFLRKTQWKKLFPYQEYCLDGTFVDPSTSCEHTGVDSTSNTDRCDNERMYGVLLVCDIVSVANENSNRSKSLILAVTWLSTCPLLLFAAVINFLFVQKNVHGWTLTAYLISMSLVNIASVILVLEEKADGCRFIDFFIKFIYFSTLCWMTSINFSLWRTFRRANPKKTSPRRFVFYLIFCTVFPGFVVTVSYFMGKNDPCEDPRKQVQCALYNYETLPFYSGPVIGMILLNLILFLRTTFKILGLRNETNAVLQKSNKDNLESFRLFTKLYLMTGSIWVIRVILLVLQVKGFYFTWYGVALEIVFSTPEAIFPIILIFHPEFTKWVGLNYPRLTKMIQRVIPCFRERRNEIWIVSFNNATSS